MSTGPMTLDFFNHVMLWTIAVLYSVTENCDRFRPYCMYCIDAAYCYRI